MTVRIVPALCAVALAASLGACRVNQEAGGGEAAVNRAVRDYVGAIDARSGRRVCGEMVPGATSKLTLPKRASGSCAASLGASIGYRDPRGYPVWRHTRLERVRSVRLDGDTARATLRVKTTFADNREPSLEDDVVYLARSGDRWLIAKPSATLYRAIGAGTPPLSSLTAP